ncbi:hypothetical protein [Hyphobacterium sp.]|uniref:hypothetical protein n=1 Tax=Hyphobacterium sp. TaxID=2004662 RepID=UPI003B52E925
MTDGTTCPPPGSARPATLTGLIVTIVLAALAAWGLNAAVQAAFGLSGMWADGVRLIITLAAILAGITLLRLYRRRPLPKGQGVS